MRVLILGGSGFLSGTLARLAAARGHETFAVTRGVRPMPEGVTGLCADRRDGDAMKAALKQAGGTFDLVADCIGFRPEDARQDVELFGGRCSRFVFISSDFVFDPAARQFPQPEDGRYLADDSYGARKRRCEEVFERTSPEALSWTVLRPGHIYGPGSRLGCLPEHGRDPELVRRILADEPLRLVGGGRFLQQPIHARDLAELILDIPARLRAAGRIFNAAGPDIIESVEYYRILATALGHELRVHEVPVSAYAEAHPEHASFLCHRIYDLKALRESELRVPATPIREGLLRHLAAVRAEA